ncbi:MAG: AsmA family protein [Saprospiraceae bacterium]
MKLLKRLLLIFGVFIVLAIGIVLAIPFLFKDELVALVKEQVNANLKATADFSDVDISLLRSFPHLSVSLQDFSLVWQDVFEGVHLATAQNAAVTIDIRSFFGANKPIEIRKVALAKPAINILVLEDGTANYDIALPAEDTTATEEPVSDMVIALQSYMLTDASIRYQDKSTQTDVEIKGLNHTGKGDFTLTQYDLDTHTDIADMTVEMEGISYLKHAQLNLDAIFNIDAEKSLYVFKDNELTVNALVLQADGSVQLLEEDIVMDLQFKAPGSDFRSLWSLIPNAYTADYANVDIAGTFRLEGLVKGTYNETTYPAFRIQTKVENGKVKYPDLPLGISNIRAFLDVNSPSSDLDDMQIKGENIGLVIDKDPFEANFSVRTPISDPDVKANVAGTIDLAKWGKAFPLDGVQEMAGIITADINMDTRLSTIEKEQYEQVKMSGDAAIENLRYLADGLPLVVINRAVTHFTPQRVVVDEFSSQLGKSDLSASGHIDNILAYISPEKTMKGAFKVHTNYFFADEWMTAEESTTPVPSEAPSATTEIFDRFDFSLMRLPVKSSMMYMKSPMLL